MHVEIHPFISQRESRPLKPASDEINMRAGEGEAWSIMKSQRQSTWRGLIDAEEKEVVEEAEKDEWPEEDGRRSDGRPEAHGGSWTVLPGSGRRSGFGAFITLFGDTAVEGWRRAGRVGGRREKRSFDQGVKLKCLSHCG